MNKSSVTVLDCTLRDGGYINNWNFSYETTQKIIGSLETAGIDIIEIGFLDNTVPENFEGTKFRDFKQLNHFKQREKKHRSQLVAMIMLGAYSLYEIPYKKDSLLDGIRLCFKKHQLKEAFLYAEEIKKKGYDLYIQPASITDYRDDEIEELLILANRLQPKAVYIVDTYGLLQKDEVKRIFSLFDKTLNEDVTVGFHSHNNLQLSFANAQEIITAANGRSLTIDSSLFGMGRGAGNLCTELITRYINDNIIRKYDLLSIMEVIDESINPLFRIYTWGYSVPYYVAALTKSHPNYATFLVDKQTIGVNAIHNILTAIPENKKRNFDEELIRKLYLSYQEKEIADSGVKKFLVDLIGNRKVLLLAPGKSIKKEISQIKEFIVRENPFCISVNFILESLDVDLIFFSNEKRYIEQKKLIDTKKIARNIVITSNIDCNIEDGVKRLNYNSLIDSNYSEPDISGAMVLRLLIELGLQEVNMAGFDGFSVDSRESFFKESLFYRVDSEANDKRNSSFESQLRDLSKKIGIRFITRTSYAIEGF